MITRQQDTVACAGEVAGHPVNADLVADQMIDVADFDRRLGPRAPVKPVGAAP